MTTLPSLPAAVLQVVRQGVLPKTITLRLEPKELGEVQLQVQAVGTDIHVQIGARNPETRALVATMLEDLARGLRHELGFQQEGDRSPQQQRRAAGIGRAIPGSDTSEQSTAPLSALVDLRL